MSLNVSGTREKFLAQPQPSHMPTQRYRGYFTRAGADASTPMSKATVQEEMSLSKFTATVASSALEHGRPDRKRKIALLENDPDMILMNSLIGARKSSTDPLQRNMLSLKICRVRRRIQRRINILRCEDAVITRMPKSAAFRRCCARLSFLRKESEDSTVIETRDAQEMAFWIQDFSNNCSIAQTMMQYPTGFSNHGQMKNCVGFQS